MYRYATFLLNLTVYDGSLIKYRIIQIQESLQVTILLSARKVKLLEFVFFSMYVYALFGNIYKFRFSRSILVLSIVVQSQAW